MSLYDDAPPPSPYRLLPVAILIVLCLACGVGGLVFLASQGQDVASPGAKASAHVPAVGGAITIADETTLYTAYWDNLAAGDAKYTGKTVEFLMRGEIEKDGSGKYMLTNYMPSPFQGRPVAVHCVIRGSSASKLASAVPSCYRVRGKCVGTRPDELHFRGPVVAVVDCEITEVVRAFR